MTRKVFWVSILLIVTGISITTAKIVYGGLSFRPEYGQNFWHVTISATLHGKEDGRIRARLLVPRDTDRQRIYNETFQSDEMLFSVAEQKLTLNRAARWSAPYAERKREIEYSFSAQVNSKRFLIPPFAVLPRDPETFYPPAIQTWLKPSKHIQSNDPRIEDVLKKHIGKEKNISEITSILYSYIRGEVVYKSEKGSKDARLTLSSLMADCGGQARLWVALHRALGIPSRVAGGIVLTHGSKKITHVWTENYVDGRWIPFDTVNNHYAFIPENYLELYKGDYPLWRYYRMEEFDYNFSIGREKLPPIEDAWSFYQLPLQFHKIVRLLLLIPVGALLVAFARVFIGVRTFGTFSPILLALAFREVSLGAGAAFLIIVLICGIGLRHMLDRLNILVIPRLAVIVTCVVMMTLAGMMLGYLLGLRHLLYVSLFPIVIITWMIERFSVLQIEDGLASASLSLLGTIVLAVAAHLIMNWDPLATYLFSFPELLLIVLACMLLLGRYTGLRVFEIKRFWSFRKHGHI